MWQQIENLIQLSQQPLPNEVDPEKNPERRNYYRFLYHLCQWRKPYVALEIGVESGLASAYMTMGIGDGFVVGIDLHKPGLLPKNNYYFVEGDSTSISTWTKVVNFVHDYGLIGVVYQDSSHHYEASQKEWQFYSQLLDYNAIWICDDILPCFHDPLIDPPGKSMVEYFQELPGDKRLYQDVLHYGNRQGVIVLNGK